MSGRGPDFTFGFFPGVCIACKQETRIGAPSVYVVLKAGERPQRFTIEALRGHCEPCLKERGFARKGVFIPVGELVAVVDAMEAEMARLQPIAAENARLYAEFEKSLTDTPPKAVEWAPCATTSDD